MSGHNNPSTPGGTGTGRPSPYIQGAGAANGNGGTSDVLVAPTSTGSANRNGYSYTSASASTSNRSHAAETRDSDGTPHHTGTRKRDSAASAEYLSPAQLKVKTILEGSSMKKTKLFHDSTMKIDEHEEKAERALSRSTDVQNTLNEKWSDGQNEKRELAAVEKEKKSDGVKVTAQKKEVVALYDMEKIESRNKAEITYDEKQNRIKEEKTRLEKERARMDEELAALSKEEEENKVEYQAKLVQIDQDTEMAKATAINALDEIFPVYDANIASRKENIQLVELGLRQQVDSLVKPALANLKDILKYNPYVRKNPDCAARVQEEISKLAGAVTEVDKYSFTEHQDLSSTSLNHIQSLIDVATKEQATALPAISTSIAAFDSKVKILEFLSRRNFINHPHYKSLWGREEFLACNYPSAWKTDIPVYRTALARKEWNVFFCFVIGVE
mmetsp:Transcript_14193/g.31717  ORF Transcript_14193/g.31717 Transcript_14193/m.31717 type:complete len:444 (+) Transcript_14193:84-1415(+)